MKSFFLIKFNLVFALLFICPSLNAQEKIDMSHRYQINKDGSFVLFSTTMGGFPVIKGGSKAYQGTIFYNPEDEMNTSATIRFSADGFSSFHDSRDKELLGENFLDVGQFPGIWFQGDEVEKTNGGLRLKGNLFIKGIVRPTHIDLEKPQVMPRSMNNQDIIVVSGKLQINRKDFDLGTSGNWGTNSMLGESIDIEFTFLCYSYTIEYLKASYVRKTEKGDHAVGLVYQDVVKNGVESGLQLALKLSQDNLYKSENWPSNLANIGWILMIDGYGEESLKFYEMALRLNPNHLPSLLRMGDAYTIAGQHDKALQYFQKEWSLSQRARFTHIPEMIRKLGGEFKLAGMK